MNLDLLAGIVGALTSDRRRPEGEPAAIRLRPHGGRAPRAPWVNGRPVATEPAEAPPADRGSP